MKGTEANDNHDAEPKLATSVTDTAENPRPDAATTLAAATATEANADVKESGAPKSSRADLAAWMKEHLPQGGEIVDEPGRPLRVRHRVAAGDNALSLAKAYLDFTWVYWDADLAALFQKELSKSASVVEVPDLITEPIKDADSERLGWPADKDLHGIYLGGNYVRETYETTLDRMYVRGMNVVVLDSKDYMGPVVYPSKVPLALEIGATKRAPVRDLARTIRFAHRKGIRAILRISCFHDPFTQEKAPRLSLKFKGTGKPADYDWLDPTNEEAHQYVVDLAKEGIEMGADEIQLDYVRFPVQDGLKWIDLPPHGVGRTHLIRDFVRKVHAVTKPRNVALSLDIFGVTSTGTRQDIEALGQDIAVLAPECEALSPMVYPSHYTNGFAGFAEPGAHPEVIGIGTRAAIVQVEAQKKRDLAKGEKHEYAVIRPWLQAFNWNSPGFGPKYVGFSGTLAANTFRVGLRSRRSTRRGTTTRLLRTDSRQFDGKAQAP